MGRLGFVALICSVVSLGLIIVSMAIPYWVRSVEIDKYRNEVTSVRVFGLWMRCRLDKDEKEATCYELKEVYEFVLAVRAFALMGLFLVTSAAILKIIHLFVQTENQNISILTGVIAIGAGVCMLIAVVIFAGRSNKLAEKETVNYHIGFALAVIAGIVALVSGVMFIVGKSD